MSLSVIEEIYRDSGIRFPQECTTHLEIYFDKYMLYRRQVARVSSDITQLTFLVAPPEWKLDALYFVPFTICRPYRHINWGIIFCIRSVLY